ncbi:MAG: hypothetical protein COV35_10940 [Alphaproteobacteria bacterium CG11_big_fil_rev_8_21_14_0_20_39_49]|nr:MAG: hypothetical protein COV35_10940 [Alphaproteobacteria bacterium CG11_big_fil_rev_8_21_14_0_20_39_49]
MRHGFVGRHFNEQIARARREENRIRQNRQQAVNRQDDAPLNAVELFDLILRENPLDDFNDINDEIIRLQRANRIRNNLIRQQENIRLARQDLANRNPNELVPGLTELSDDELSDNERENNPIAQRRVNNQGRGR